MMGEERGSIAFCSTYRPPVPLDLYSCPIPPKSEQDELRMTDAVSSNYNAQIIPPAALKAILKRPELANSEAKEADVDSGRLSAMLFVSERTNNLETLHIALRFNDKPPKVQVFGFADVFGTFNGVRMEDSGCIAGDYLVYVSTMEPADDRRQPWTAVYKTNLKTGKTDHLTPKGVADLSPSVSPSGKMVAVASFQRQAGWHGEIENLKTDIFVMNVDDPQKRKLVVKDGGWPTWGSDSILFFHRKVGKNWGVFRADISNVGSLTSDPSTRVTPDGIDAITPAAIDATTVAVATIRQKSELSNFSDVHGEEAQCRHIEIFYLTGRRQQPVQITRKTKPKADHYNPFVIVDTQGETRIGYHRCRNDSLQREDEIPKQFHKLQSAHQEVGVFRVSGVFPTFSIDGSKLAFVDNEFKAVWVADSQGLRPVFEADSEEEEEQLFCPVWNQNPEKDTLYVCMGRSFSADKELNIYAIPNVSSGEQDNRPLTRAYNNASPSTNPEGTKLVFRSTRDGGDKRYKNLYIMDAQSGEYGRGAKITRLTNGPWFDTHCQWSPRGDWIVFSSTRDKPAGAPESDNGLDPGYYAVYLVKADDPTVVVRVLGSGPDLAGHVNHPFFSPDGKSIVVAADLAAVSADPISLPLFLHSVRPYGDIFSVDIDPDDINKNRNVKKFNRITHSRYENSTAVWTMFSTQDPKAAWNLQFSKPYRPLCPYLYPDGGENWQMTGHLCLPKRCC